MTVVEMKDEKSNMQGARRNSGRAPEARRRESVDGQ